MKTILFLVLSSVASSAWAACITPGSSADEKKAVGAAISKVTGGVSSWTEVVKGSNLMETRNTIRMNVKYVDPFDSSFRVGNKSEGISQICESGGKVTITTAKGPATLQAGGGGLVVSVSLLGLKKQYYLLPSKNVKKQAAEIDLPQYETFTQGTPTLL